MAQVFGSPIGGIVAQLFGDFRVTIYLAAIMAIAGSVFFSVRNERHQVD